MREKGYYIYYVRNEKMQNYIISRKRETAESATDSVVIKDKTVVENFRERGNRRRTGRREAGVQPRRALLRYVRCHLAHCGTYPRIQWGR